MPDTSTADTLATRCILIAGAPRSGTTWLAKIFDSHPAVLYRHEPDEVAPPGDSIQDSVARWVVQTDPRTAGKRPYFPKSWRSGPARLLRTGLAYASAAAGRAGLPAWHIPDLGRIGAARVVIKSVRLSRGIGEFAAAFPEGRAVFIPRHPCGQVASVMRGTKDGRFVLAEEGTDMPFDEAGAIAFAARFGLDEPAFQRLPDAGKYAWAWRAFNETALAGLEGLANARVVVYEDLCASPASQVQSLFAFAGLPWHAQTAAFLDRSTTYDGQAGYYAVVRNSIAAADRWRTAMPPADQEAVRAVVRDSPLARYWSDLVH